MQRQTIWEQIKTNPTWDVVIVGGGITGAGILREAARAGLRALLVEQRDFAWGTSSRSSKLVHGGLRYLKQGQVGLTYQSVRERQNLLKDGIGLVTPLGFLMPTYKGDSRLTYEMGLSLYDLMAQRWNHRYFPLTEFAMLAPRIRQQNLEGGFYFEDAQTDDARLVLRVLQDALEDGGVAINYAPALGLIKNAANRVGGLRLQNAETGEEIEVKTDLVVNAAGAWVDHLRREVTGESVIRPLRGSHLIIAPWRFPVAQALSFPHPADGRPVFVYPWEGVTLLGTTDLDHEHDLDQEPHITGEEVAYLLAACNHQFPALNLTADDILSTYAGVRPVIGTGKSDPSKESRDHIVWLEDGLLSVTGGKLTTFRVIALDALKTAQILPESEEEAPAFTPFKGELPPHSLKESELQRLIGRYGAKTPALLAAAGEGELCPIPQTNILWAELRWAARSEQVQHLEDLFLRRTRLGLLAKQGGLPHLGRIRAICQPELGWDDEKWEAEAQRYHDLWCDCYSVPSDIPSWQDYIPTSQPVARPLMQMVLVGALTALVIFLLIIWLSERQESQL